MTMTQEFSNILVSWRIEFRFEIKLKSFDSHFVSGYMALFLTLLQMLTLFCSHLLITRTGSTILLTLLTLAIASVGGYIVHIGEIPKYLWWSERLSPERWMLPVIMADEFSQETLSNTASQQLCRNKHVNKQNSFIVFSID